MIPQTNNNFLANGMMESIDDDFGDSDEGDQNTSKQPLFIKKNQPQEGKLVLDDI